MKDGDIPNGNIRASSYYNNHYPYYARLDGYGFWKVFDSRSPWIQADIGYQTYVTGVATQGVGSARVTSFAVAAFLKTTSDDPILVSEPGRTNKVKHVFCICSIYYSIAIAKRLDKVIASGCYLNQSALYCETNK